LCFGDEKELNKLFFDFNIINEININKIRLKEYFLRFDDPHYDPHY